MNQVFSKIKTMIKIGDKAPDFKGTDQEGKEIKLSDFKG